jgi:hypothetical protein
VDGPGCGVARADSTDTASVPGLTV